MADQFDTNPIQNLQSQGTQNQAQGQSSPQQSLIKRDQINQQDVNASQNIEANIQAQKPQLDQSQLPQQNNRDTVQENQNQINRQNEQQHKLQDGLQNDEEIEGQQVRTEHQNIDSLQPHQEGKLQQGQINQFNKETTPALQPSQSFRYLQKQEQRQNEVQQIHQQEQYQYDQQIERQIQEQIQQQIKEQNHQKIQDSKSPELRHTQRQQQIIQFTDKDFPLRYICNKESQQFLGFYKAQDFRYAGIEDSSQIKQQQKNIKKPDIQTRRIVSGTNPVKQSPKQTATTKNNFVIKQQQRQRTEVIERRQVQPQPKQKKKVKKVKTVKTSNPSSNTQTKQQKGLQKNNKIVQVQQTKSVKNTQPRIVQQQIKQQKRESQNKIVNRTQNIKTVEKVVRTEIEPSFKEAPKNNQSTNNERPKKTQYKMQQESSPQLLRQQNRNQIRRDLGDSNPPPQKQNPSSSTLRITIMSTTETLHQVTEPELLPPPLTSLMVVSQAVKQRVGTTYNFFLKYIFQYEKAVNYYKNIVQNVHLQIERRKNSKKQLMNILLDYFSKYSKLNAEFYQRCYKIQSFEQQSSANPFQNIKAELKTGYQQLIFLRKSVANESYKIAGYIENNIKLNIIQAFEVYNATIGAEEKRQIDRRVYHLRRESILKKLVASIDKNFNRGMQGREKQDIFGQIIKLINQQKVHRQSLKNYGHGLIDLRQAYIHSEKGLFNRLQQILNDFKTHSKTIYSVGRRQFEIIQDLTGAINVSTRFSEISNLTDLDYIKYVLQLQSKKETSDFTNRNFEQYLQLVYFDKIVGNIKDLYKGATTKVFPLQNGEELVHTVSGNLVHFDRVRDEFRDKFVIKNLNVKMVGQGIVEFDEVIRGIIFDDNRTLRFKLRDADRAEELICYLNEKEEDIILPNTVVRVP